MFDPSAKSVAGVHVHLEEATQRKQWDIDTKPDGTFRFDKLDFGTYRVTIQHEGYFAISTEVRLESSKTAEFTLAAAETVKQEVDVIARPEAINTDSIAPQNVVNSEVIQNIPYTGRQNFLNALSLMPGVLRDSNDQIHIHGSRPDQVRYQLDGLNLTDAAAGGLGSNIPIDAVESVDLDLANYSAEFGKSSGGVVNVHSQFIADKFRFNVTDFIPGWDFRQASIAEFSPRLLFSGPVVRHKLWFMYSGTMRYIHTFLEELPTPNNEKTRTQTDADQLLKLQWNLRESHVMTFEVLHNSHYLGNVGLSVIRPRETTTNSLQRGVTFGFSDRRVIRGKLFETVLQLTRRRGSDLAKGTQPLEAHPDSWKGNFFTDRRDHGRRFHVLQTIAWDKQAGAVTHRIKAGAEFDAVDSSLQLDRRSFTLFNEQGDLRQLVTFAGPDFADTHNQEYGAFVQDRIVVNPKFQVEVGIRYDRENVVGRNNLSPRAGFSFLPFGTARSKVSGGAGLFYDNLTLISLQLPQLQRRFTTAYANGGVPTAAAAATDVQVSPELRNPSGLHWNLAWEHEWAPRWVSRIDYIRKHGRDQLRVAAQTNSNGFDMVFNNSGKSDYRAVEFTLDRPIRTNLRFLASYIYSDARTRPSLSLDFPDPAVEGVPEAPVEWNTPHRFVAWGYFPLPSRISASFSVEARSGFSYTAVDDLNHVVGGYNSRAMPMYSVTNASIEKEIPIPFGSGKRMAFRVGVINLFNRYNPRFVDANVDSSTFGSFSDSSSRHLYARVRILKK